VNAAKLIDTDEARYSVEVLRKWKRLAEEDALADIESGHSTKDRVSNEDNECDITCFHGPGGWLWSGQEKKLDGIVRVGRAGKRPDEADGVDCGA
jgi:hypothetical protein